MKIPNEKILSAEENQWNIDKNLLVRERNLKTDKREFIKSGLPKIQTTKLLIMFLFLNCTFIEIFTGYITLKSFDLAYVTGCSPDLTPLITLIGSIVSEVIGFAIYSLKSLKENIVGGIVYENAMRETGGDLSESSG